MGTHADSDDVALVGLNSKTNAVFLLSCLSLGVGVFAIPTVMNSVGWVVGVIMVLFFGALSTALMLLVLSIIESRDCGNWDSLVGLLPGGLAVSRVSMVAALITGNAGHLQFIAGMLFDLMAYFVTHDYGNFPFTAVHKLVILTLLLGVALPYTFMDNLAALQHVGKAVAGVVLTTCLVASSFSIFQAFSGKGATGENTSQAGPDSLKSVFTAMSTIAFAFTSMFNLFEVFDAMKRGSPNDYVPKMRAAVIWAGVIVTAIYLMVSIASIVAFGVNAGISTKGNGSGNVLYNFPADNYVITILCLALVIVIVLDYAIIIFPVVNIFMRITGSEKRPYARQMINIGIALFVITVVMVVPDLTDIFGLCGSLGVSVFCYLLPALVCLRFHPHRLAKLVSVIGVLVGLTMLVLSTFFIFENVAQGH